ncbi:MAG: serine/threonine-protein kinase [Pirellula sp.]
MEFEAGILIGDFRIEQRIGAGGMGIVYRARQLSLNRDVALKVLGGSIQTDSGIARFRREAQAIAKLKHQNIAGVLYIGQDDRICYMAMDLIDGICLREVIRRAQRITKPILSLEETVIDFNDASLTHPAIRFDVETADIDLKFDNNPRPLSVEASLLIQKTPYVRRCAEYIRDVSLALAYAHDNGVVHRDIKPENLLLDRSGKVTVIDFGLARFYEDETITYTGQLVGTPLYMSPEQVLGGKSITTQTDIYSLGMVLYELLTLEPPFESPNRESLFRQIMTKSLAPVSWRNPSVPETLTAIVHHALAKDMSERYANMEAFANDLSNYLLGKAVKAPPYRYRFDEGEIRAKRPGAVVYLSFLCFFMAIMTGVPATIAEFLFFKWKIGVIIPLIAILVVTILLFCLGQSLLLGRNWAKVAGLITGVILLCVSIVSIAISWIPHSLPFGFHPQQWMLTGISCGVCAPAFLGILLYPKVSAWFKFASEARNQFRQLKRNRKSDAA